MQKRFQTLQYCAFQKLNFLADFFPLLLPIYTNTFFSKDKGDSLYWMENFNSSFGYFSAVHGRSWPCHSWHQNKSSLSKASNILMALLTSSCACYNSSQWTLRHGLLKKFIELSRECFCVPHLTTFWDTMNPTRHERHISHLEGDCRSGGLMLSVSGCWKGKGAADPSTLAQASTACSQQGSSQKQGCPGPSDHPSARAEGARGKLQPKSELCSSCSNNNYQDTFLLPLITAGSGSCNIPSVFLLKHKLEREPWTEMKWPRGTRNCQLPGDKQRSLADKRDICWKQTPASCWACGCSRPPLSLDVKQNFHFAELWSWDKLGSGSHQMGKRVKPVTSTSTAARGKKISLVFQCVWYSSDLQWLPGPWRLGLATESHKKEFAKDHYSLAFRQAFSTGK